MAGTWGTALLSLATVRSVLRGITLSHFCNLHGIDLHFVFYQHLVAEGQKKRQVGVFLRSQRIWAPPANIGQRAQKYDEMHSVFFFSTVTDKRLHTGGWRLC